MTRRYDVRANEMKRWLQIFELSKNQQRVVLIIILVLLTIASVGYECRIRRSALQPSPPPQATPSSMGVQTEEHH